MADNPETIDGLHAYLSRAGVSLLSSRRLHFDSLALHAQALVIFPDEFRVAQVLQALAMVREAQPRLPILLVTSAPQHFAGAPAADASSRPPIILAKPAFGWTILDAIRVHVGTDDA